MWPWVVGVGAAALSAHYCLTRAFMLEDAAVVMPIDFLRLPFIAVIGFIFYHEPLELWVFIGAAIVHLFALMFGAGDKGFEVTFRVMAYSSGSTAVLNVVPIVGGLAAWVWSLIATIIGLTEAQETSGGKAAAAVLVPLLLLCCCGIAVVIALVFAAGAADAF
jgi:hypothetical protein